MKAEEKMSETLNPTIFMIEPKIHIQNLYQVLIHET